MKRIYSNLIILIILSFSSLSFKTKDNSENPDNQFVNSRILDGNAIKTVFRNNGSFNRDPTTGNAGFEFPRNTSKFARYASGLWIGANVGNDTLVAICEYDYEYLPGYTDSAGNPQATNDPVYKIYKLTFGQNDIDRMEWPNILLGNSDQGAPVYFDSLTGVVRPIDFGTQTMFYNFTDSYPEAHLNQAGMTLPLKADIKQLNFTYFNSNNIAYDFLIFTQYIIINRSNNIWRNTVFSLWSDDDIGDPADDKIACDSALQMGYSYNATNFDNVYLSSPPAVGTILLQGPLKFTGNSNDIASYCINNKRVTKTGYKKTGINAFSNNSNSTNFRESYRLMNGLNLNGAPVINPVGGFQTKLYYTGDPLTNTGWNLSTPGDQRFLLSTEPVDVAPGDTQVIALAQVIARGINVSHNIALIREYSTTAKELCDDCYNFDPVGINENNSNVSGYYLSQNFPNPFNPITKINYTIPSAGIVSIKVYDILGNEISELVNKMHGQGTYETDFDGNNISSGIYFYKLTVRGNSSYFTETKRMVLLK